eukprot:gene8295-8481_t
MLTRQQQTVSSSCKGLWLALILLTCSATVRAEPKGLTAVRTPSRGAVKTGTAAASAPAASSKADWTDVARPAARRVADLVSKLTIDEKIGLMNNKQAAIKRLNIPQYEFWTECLHGHQERNEKGVLPTIFPQPMLLASTFDDMLAWQVFTAISDELRAKSNHDLQQYGEWKYLSCWTPHVNIFRDPRWGRGSETFGEDPYLTSVMATRVVQGLQGNNKEYKKVVAACKHFLGYSLEGAEGISRQVQGNRHLQQLTAAEHENYCIPEQSWQSAAAQQMSSDDGSRSELYQFGRMDNNRQYAKAQGIMCSYNAFNGTPACANEPMLTDVLRSQLGFNGYVVSDCNAIMALSWGHQTATSLADASAAAINAGVDIFCDRIDEIKNALSSGKLSQEALDKAISRTLAIRFATGQFDPRERNPWQNLTLAEVNSRDHRALAKSVVVKGSVLLKNTVPTGSSSPVLPLDKATLKKVCVVGPLAASVEHMMGNYYGRFNSKVSVTPLKGIQDELAGSGTSVEYSYGMDVLGQMHYDWPLESALQACSGASVGVVVLGASMVENGLNATARSYDSGQQVRSNIKEVIGSVLVRQPSQKADLVKALATRASGLPLMVVLMHGGGFDIDWMQKLPTVNAILAVGFPGQEGGRGIADLLFGRASPSGRLPITWYRSKYTDSVSPLTLDMRPNDSGHPGRSYRFLTDGSYVLYPFGYGLQYTTFVYSNLRVVPAGKGGCRNGGRAPAFCVGVGVTNTGGMPAEHVVPMYLAHTAVKGTGGNPKQSLRGFERTKLLQPGETQQVVMLVDQNDFLLTRTDGSQVFLAGPWLFSVGVWDAPPAGAAGASASRKRSSGTNSSTGTRPRINPFFADVFGNRPETASDITGPTADSRIGMSVIYEVTA